MMSRAGLSSVFQRAVSGGGIGMGSGHGSRKSSGRSSGQLQHEQQRHQQQQKQQRQQQKQFESTSNDTNNHRSLSPARSFSVRHQDLSPQSKARQLAATMNSQEKEQLRLIIPMPTQQSSPPTAVNSGSYVISNSNRTGVDDGVGVATSSIVQGVTNLHLSPQRPSSSQQPQPQTPPSPRALLLKKMQNNDEEDWEKAWAEDSEDSDDDGDATPKRANNNIAVPAATGILPTVPYLEQGTIGGQTLPQQLQKVDGAVQVVATSASLSSAHLPFTPTDILPRELPLDHEHEQQQRQHSNDVSSLPGMSKTPTLQYPPIRPDPHFVSPEDISTQRELDEDERLMREANEALQHEEVGEDGRRYDWNSYIREDMLQDKDDVAEDERPCVNMFDPALRVLGRGSFGRVSLVSITQFLTIMLRCQN